LENPNYTGKQKKMIQRNNKNILLLDSNVGQIIANAIEHSRSMY